VLLVAALGLAYRWIDPVSTLMIGRWATGRPVEHVAVPLEAVSPFLTLAVVTSEDARFCRHGGIDWDALRQVMDDDGEPSRGASTITMQTAKNLFLWPGRSYLRKAMELPLALYLNLVWGKRRSLENYLNIAEWGDGVFGAEAAARRHFGKSARDLTRGEAALLATALPNQIRRLDGRASPALRARAGRLTARMQSAGRSLIACLGRGPSS